MGKFFHAFFSPLDFLRAVPQVWDGFQTNIKLMVIAEALVLVFALVHRDRPRPAGPRCSSRCVPSRSCTRTSFAATPLILVLFIVGLGVPALDIAGHLGQIALRLRDRLADARLHGVRDRGVPRRHRVRASEPAHGCPLARTQLFAGAPVRRPAAGDPARDPAAPERLHRPPEGHRAHHRPRPHRGGGAGGLLLLRLLQLRGVHRRGRVLHHPHDPARPLHGPPRSRSASSASGRKRCDRRQLALRHARERHEALRRPRGAARDRPDGRPAPGRLPDRRIGLGQVDASSLREPARARRRGDDRRRRPDRSRGRRWT